MYVGSKDNKVYALKTSDGTPRWSFKTGGPVVSSPALSSYGATVYVGSGDKKVYALKTSDGTLGDRHTIAAPPSTLVENQAAAQTPLSPKEALTVGEAVEHGRHKKAAEAHQRRAVRCAESAVGRDPFVGHGPLFGRTGTIVLGA